MLTLRNLVQTGLIVLSLGFTAFFASAETALFAVDPFKIEALADKGNTSARMIQRILQQKERLLGVLLIGTNLAMVFGTVMATSLVEGMRIFGEVGPLLSATAMVILVLVFAEVLPKTYAARNATRVSLFIIRVLHVIYLILAPISVPFEAFPKLLLRLMGGPRGDMPVTEDAILTMISIGKEEGKVDEDEGEMIEAVLESDTTLVRDLMVPRVDMVCVSRDDDPIQVVDKALEAGFSRIPVYEGTIDNVIGIVCVKDLLTIFSREGKVSLCDFLRPVYYVPETKSAMELLKELKAKHLYMAIVLDEFGGTAGLVTMEDLVEEIVGEIRDEYDYDEEDPVILRPDGSYIIDARMPVDEVNEAVGVELPQGEFTTIGGLLYTLIGRVPEKGEVVSLEEQGCNLVAENVTGRKIRKVRLIKLQNLKNLQNIS